jgi:hypothetical protein
MLPSPSQILNLLCLSLLFLVTELSSFLGNNSLQLSLTGSLSLRALGVHLLLKDSLTRLLGLGLVDLCNSSGICMLVCPPRINLHARPMLAYA